MVEQGTHKPLVVGSSPTLATNYDKEAVSYQLEDLPHGRFSHLKSLFTPLDRDNYQQQLSAKPIIRPLHMAGSWSLKPSIDPGARC